MLTTKEGHNVYSVDLQKEAGRAAVIAAKGITIDSAKGTLVCASDPDHPVSSGDVITIDGSSGLVYRGELPTEQSGQDEYFYTVLNWADKYKKMRVFASCDSLVDVRKAYELGATGLGLLRTESMFLEGPCLDLFRRVLLSDSEAERCKHLSSMLPVQEDAFVEVFRAMDNRPVTVRLLDCPLQCFFPSPRSASFREDVAKMADRLGLPLEECLVRIKSLQEVNPMLGKRGCRLSILHPEITIMQTKAIIGEWSVVTSCSSTLICVHL